MLAPASFDSGAEQEVAEPRSTVRSLDKYGLNEKMATGSRHQDRSGGGVTLAQQISVVLRTQEEAEIGMAERRFPDSQFSGIHLKWLPKHGCDDALVAGP